MLISDMECHYAVEWQTEYACAEDYLVATKSCKLTASQHGIDFDLTPLAKEGGKFKVLVIIFQNSRDNFVHLPRHL